MVRLKVLLCFLSAISVFGLNSDIVLGAGMEMTPRKLRFEVVSVKDGLSESGVLCLIQDEQGFLWLGTYDGLNRFDGYDFLVFRPEPQNPHSISDTGIRSLHQDRTGNIWIGTSNGGLNVYNKNTARFQRFQSNPENPGSLSNNEVRSILEDRHGLLWVGTQSDLNVFDRTEGAFRHYKHDPADPKSICEGRVGVIYEDPDGNLWIGTEKGLSRYNRETDSFSNIYHIPDDPVQSGSIGGAHIGCLLHESPGFLWIGSKRPGLNRLEISTGKVTHYLENCDVYCMHKDRLGNFWIGTDKGVARRIVSGENEKYPSYFFYFDKHRPYDPESLSHDTVLSIVEDNSGILWFGTLGGGLSKLNPAVQAFGLLRREPENENSLSGNHISAICESDNGILWIGTYKNGLNRVDRKTGRVTRLPLSMFASSSPQGNIVRFLMMDHEGFLWIGTGKTGLVRTDQELRNITIYRHDVNDRQSLSEDNVYYIFEDSRRNIWVGTSTKGLNLLNRKTGTFKRYRAEQDNPHSISHNRVRHIIEGRDGCLWLGTNRGLNRFDMEKEVFTHWEHDPGNPDSISHNRVTPIVEDAGGALWVGTDMGLNRFDPETQVFKRYTTRDGFENDAIQSMEIDTNGRLWMGTFKGITMLDPENGQIYNYNSRDGLQGAEFWFNAGYKNEEGELFFGGLNGLNFFFPQDIKVNRHKPPVVITGLKVMNQARPLPPSTQDDREVALSYNDLFFSLSFAALDYAASEENRYKYMLEGFDRNWVDIGNTHTAVYTNIDPGSYVFRVKAANNDGVWNNEGTSLHITVTPPFWRTTWFILLAVLSIIACFFGLYTYRVKSLKAQKERLGLLVNERTIALKEEIEERKHIEVALQDARDYLEERVIERTERLRRLTSELSLTEERQRRVIAANLHDNICQNLALSEIKLKQIKDDRLPSELKSAVAGVAALINKMSVDVRSLMVELSPQVLYDIGLEAALHWLADEFEDRYGLETNLINNTNTLNINDDIKILLFRSVRELMFNIVKHAQTNMASITISTDDSNITIVVEDDGVGFDVGKFDDRSNRAYSFGLFSIRERLLALGGQMTLVSETNKGVRAAISVPFKNTDTDPV